MNALIHQRFSVSSRHSSPFHQIYLPLIVMGTGAVQSIPEWMTKEFLQNIFNKFNGGNNCTIQDFSSSVISSKTIESQVNVYKVSIQLEQDGQPESVSLIFKTAGDNYLDREIRFYESIAPEVRRLLEDVGDLTVIAPKCYHISRGSINILAVQDLKSADYSKHQEGRLLNLEHALLIIGKMAKLHACSAVINQNTPDLLEAFVAKPEVVDEEFTDNFKLLTEEVAQWTGYEEIADKLAEFERTLFEKEQAAFEDNRGCFQVLNHNNLWLNNILFHYDNHNPEGARLINYISAFFGSPGVDLNYFLYGSVNENSRKIHFKFMVREYHRILKETLEKLKYKGGVPTLKDIHIEMIRKSFHAVVAAIGITPRLLNTNLEDFEVIRGSEPLVQDEEDGAWTTIRYRKYIQKLLKEFELSGYLD